MEISTLNPETDTSRTEELLRASEAGDTAALNELLNLHRDYLRRVVEIRLDPALKGRVDASDIVQETQIIATKRLKEYLDRRPTSFKLWLRGEAMQQIGIQRRRHIVAAQRSVNRECSVTDASSLLIARRIMQGTPSKIVARKELGQRVRQLLEDMSDTDREILLLRFVEDLTNAEAAELLQIDPATSRKRHGRALKRLAELIVKSGLVSENEMGSA